ncbi:enoyl-CoA hydratase/isomerase family protein [Orrella marina]|uniref:Enoyl-CoA hydratase n=1 Tax=Orrella marina TaxID=2163011 RepID=A0A2R4XG87_9BURK|nr:enoyl-CoA hydratase/isomerase family protein [Orrella marina]AWB32830.1 enoyl-CoA hydratase [Orrella marina]
MSFETLDVKVENDIAVVTLNRPPVNAQNAQLRSELIEVFDSFNDRTDVKVVVLTGTGKTFSGGADINERPNLGTTPGAYWRHNRLVRECSNSISECNKPVICAVNGPAIGAGFGLMTACDIWIASNTAVFAMTEINVGLAGGTAMLQSIFGKSRARRMFFTGMKITADEMYRLGLIEASLPPEELMPYTMELAQEIASKAPIALRYAKEASQVTAVMPRREGYRFEQNITVALSKTEDTAEAQRAFKEKRQPVYKGR